MGEEADMAYKGPSISVVIPTIGRPSLQAAVESALTQSQPPLEVIVGADTVDPLDLPVDARIRVVRTGPGGGGNAARTAALSAARGELIALLDDDDVWKSEKLRDQLEVVSELDLDVDVPWVVSSRYVDADGRIRPEALVDPNEHPLGYLFEKRSIRGGTGKLHTSTLLFPRWITYEVPFDPTVKFNQDPTWYIQLLARFPSAVFVHHPRPLMLVGASQGSISGSVRWRQAAEWCRVHMAGLDPRWRGDYVLMDVLGLALRYGAAPDHARAFVSAFRLGRPGTPAIIQSIARVARHHLLRLGR